jgi:diguanylate cyclase (GGDEF)-like protein
VITLTSIDTLTLVLLTVTVAFGLGAMSIALTFHHSGTHGTRGLRYWGRGLVAYSGGTLLLYLYPRLGLPALYAGWLCILLSMLVMYRALLRICGMTDEHRTRFGIGVIGGTVLTWLYFSLIYPNPIRQSDATSVAIAVIAGRACWDIWHYAMRSRFRAPAFAVLIWLALTTFRPLLEVLKREVDYGELDPLSVFGPPGMVFFRVLVLTLLSISVIWLEISRLYEAVEDQATHDELTGIANRRAIVALLERELVRAGRLRTPCSIALIDIDHFKRVNDTYGHPAGDQVLKWVTEMIGKSIRPYDSLGRYGGEEFLLLMPGALPEAGMAVIERARTAIQGQDCLVDGKPVRITISAGVAASSEETDSDTLLRAADRMLYRAKQQGRNRTVLAKI